MLNDQAGRHIDYLRISVTDRCNFRCVYCMPPGGIALKQHDEILSFERIAEVARAAAGLGISKIRLTGGEPLVRRGLPDLVALLAPIEGIGEVSMTTNGSLLFPETARALKRAGLARVNVSLDTLDAERFREITRGGEIVEAVAGIVAAREAGLDPVKVNMVVFDGTTPEEIDRMRGFCGANGLVLQTIRRFRLDGRPDESRCPHVCDRPLPCERCNKIRLTADGFLKPCLFDDHEIPVDFEDVEGSLRRAVREKPRRGTGCVSRSMNEIGG
ncbi:MAG: radical SAM protein [Candidatus Krumholzibacteriota bacterium]|nr:radical SAM protein [Candidatus Krumholzibacteriota bacterium]